MLARGKPGKRAAARVEYVGWVEEVFHGYVVTNCWDEHTPSPAGGRGSCSVRSSSTCANPGKLLVGHPNETVCAPYKNCAPVWHEFTGFRPGFRPAPRCRPS